MLVPSLRSASAQATTDMILASWPLERTAAQRQRSSNKACSLLDLKTLLSGSLVLTLEIMHQILQVLVGSQACWTHFLRIIGENRKIVLRAAIEARALTAIPRRIEARQMKATIAGSVGLDALGVTEVIQEAQRISLLTICLAHGLVCDIVKIYSS